MQVKFKVRDEVEETKKYLKEVPRGTVKTGLAAIAEWIIGTPKRGLKHYQAYKYITRKAAYGKTFVSDKQRRYVMAMIKEGRIDPGAPHRTGNTQRAWYAQPTNNGYAMTIGNKTKGAYYTRHDEGQARLNALAGWRTVSDIISTNIKGALRHAGAKIKEYLARK